MFIYHFSRLIKSKLLWGFLALLMVFAFVVMDSCSGSAPTGQALGYLNGEAVGQSLHSDATQTSVMLSGQAAYYLPRQAQVFAALLREENAGANDWATRRRETWKILAARAVADRQGLAVGQAAAVPVLEMAFAGPDGAFNPQLYRAFLAANNYQVPKLFEDTFANVWLPSQAITLAVFNSVGWVSPMEQDFALSATYDTTVAYAATLKNTLKAETIEVSDADLQAWYDAHQDDYALPEQRRVETVEVPLKAFADKIKVEEMDAMQYYDDHSEEFRGTGTNATKTLPFEEVKDKAIAKVRDLRALEEALVFANETLVPKAQTKGFAEAAKGYGEPKTTTLRQDRPFGFQNAGEFFSAIFEMDPEETPLNAIPGTDRVYLARLVEIIPEHIAPLAEVKERVRGDIRRDRLAQRLKTNGETLRNLLQGELAKGTAFDKAVAACKTDGLTATTAMTFTLSEAAQVQIPHRNEIFEAVSLLGEKGLSQPIVTPANELLLVYVAERRPGDALAKATAKTRLAQSLGFGSAFQLTSDWLNWNLDRDPPVTADGVPVLAEDLEMTE